MGNRPGHKLKVLTRCVHPEHIIFVDTETTQHKEPNGRVYHKLMLGVAIYGRFRRDGKANQRVLYRFTNKTEFWSFVNTKCYNKTVLYLISHNAVFDFVVLSHISQLQSLGYNCQFVYEGGVTFISKWVKKGHSIIILDNSNWFAGKLERWGKELEIPKLEMPVESSNKERWFTYCERDTEILYQLSKWYFEFLQSNNLGSWKYTIASSAFAAFRHRFMGHNIYIPDEKDDTDLARRSYHGGRTECFQVGEFNSGPYYKLDINSMYPYVMRNYEYPVCFEGRYKNPDKRKTYLCTKRKSVIADCLISTSIPYFVYKQNDRNIYPIGEFRTILSTEEFRLACSNGWIKEIYDVCVYRKRRIFKEYVDFFYGIKTRSSREGKILLRAFSKLYLNSLYGKFGQRGFIDRVIGQDSSNTLRVSYGYNARTGERYTLRQVGHQVIYSEKGGESYNAFCSIASHVTANARVLLYDSILRAKRENVFYCDTDSIITNSRGFTNLIDIIDSSRLGFWKVEEIADSIEIVAPKHYRFGDKIVMKGVRKNAELVKEKVYRNEIWPGFNSILREGREEYYNYYQIKTLSPSIQSGVVQTNGHITPFVIG